MLECSIMRSLADNRKAVASARSEDWPFRVSDLARALEAELGRPDVLVAVANRLLTIAKDHGCQAVVGASRVGSHLAGALVARSVNALRLFSPAEPAESVLVVDGILATGTQVVRAVREARKAGAKHIVVAAALANHDAIGICRGAIQGDIVALDEF